MRAEAVKIRGAQGGGGRRWMPLAPGKKGLGGEEAGADEAVPSSAPDPRADGLESEKTPKLRPPAALPPTQSSDGRADARRPPPLPTSPARLVSPGPETTHLSALKLRAQHDAALDERRERVDGHADGPHAARALLGRCSTHSDRLEGHERPKTPKPQSERSGETLGGHLRRAEAEDGSNRTRASGPATQPRTSRASRVCALCWQVEREGGR